MSDDEGENGEADAIASDVFPQQCSALRKNGFVVLKGAPCKIVEMSTSKTGKHGHAKVHLVGIDIFNGKKYEDICPSTHNMMVPNVTRTDMQLINVDEDFLSLLDEDGNSKDDLKIPEGEIGEKIKADFEGGKDILVSVQKAMGIEAVVGYKEASV